MSQKNCDENHIGNCYVLLPTSVWFHNNYSSVLIGQTFVNKAFMRRVCYRVYNERSCATYSRTNTGSVL